MRKQKGGIIVFEYAFRERDHVTLGEDGLRTLRYLLSEGRQTHRKWLKEKEQKKSIKALGEWSKQLLFADKIIQQLFFSAKKVIVEVDWDKWHLIEKELERQMRTLNK